MKEKIYTIPVNDAFNTDCECPICIMRKKLETDAVEYVMGPSYMEDDIRAETDRIGFCSKHLQSVYNMENRLGFALVMKTRMDKIISDAKKLQEAGISGKSLFKKADTPEISKFTKEQECSCYVCNKIDNTFDRYLDTVLYMYKSDSAFKNLYNNSKGFCTTHYGMLIEMAVSKFSGDTLNSFVADTNRLYIENMERVRDDVTWFINKFDHRYANEPWKNAKDSLTRAMTKEGSIL